MNLYKFLSKEDNPGLDVLGDIVKLAIECVYNCSSSDMYQEAKEMFEIVSEQYRKIPSQVPEDVLENWEKELNALEILGKYRVLISLQQIRIGTSDVESVANLMRKICETVRSMLVQRISQFHVQGITISF